MICFVHIERTAGTTLHTILQNNYLSYVTVTPWYKGSTNVEDNYFTKNEAKYFIKILPYTKGFGGNTVNSYFNYEQVLNYKIDYIISLRNPIQRYISHYNLFNRKHKMNCDINEYLRMEQHNNGMTKRIAGSADLDKAKKILVDNFSFVLLTEKIDECLLMMRNKLKLKNFCIFYEKMNIASNVNYRQDGIYKNKKVMDEVYRNNTLDIELYDFAKNNIYQNYVRDYGPKLETDVADFRKLNKNYKFSKIKRFYSTVYRGLITKRLQYVLHYIFHRKSYSK